uniref:F-box domain-containing protein n=1 Tax=Steinernema glaseri TaxID=37863 RepID=A0A1I8A1W9_9BILA
MDTVPLKFVDSVVEFFGKDTLDELAKEVRHPLWKDVVDLHHRNRVYYKVDFWKEKKGGIKHVFKNRTEVDLSINTRTLKEKGRFTRIVGVYDAAYRDLSYRDEVEPHGEAEATKLLETIFPLIDPVSSSYSWVCGSTYCTKWLLPLLFKRVHLQRIIIPYCGQIAYDFLEDQINNSPFLNYVQISGKNWPKSTLDLVTKFCFKGRPGKRVEVCLYSGIHLEGNYIQNLLDLWKANGNLHFELFSFEDIMDEEGIRALMSKGQEIRHPKATQEDYNFRRFFKHETEKSVLFVSNHGFVMKCYNCECDKFEKCLLKNDYPEYHKF